MENNLKAQTSHEKKYCPFTLLINYTHRAARARGRKSQTHRYDYTAVKFQRDGIDISNMHPVEVLHRKYLMEKMVTYRARIFDNTKTHAKPLFDVMIEDGVVYTNCDERDLYYSTGTPRNTYPYEIARIAKTTK